MSKINKNFLKLQDSYLFVTITEKVKEYQRKNPEKEVIKLGIGDITRPIPHAIANAMKKAVDEMLDTKTFRGYGPEVGYDFLKEKIIENDYKKLGIDFENFEIFISDGIGTDIGNIVDVFDIENKVAITDPVYPAYLDTNVMSGRSGTYSNGKYAGIEYLTVNAENKFIPQIPEEKIDMIYFCFPNNPTGTVISKEELKKWVDYAIENNSVILYDAAYEAYIQDEDIPHSIYEIEGAKKVAIEFKSYSKSAGFTGIRCGYTVVPKELLGYTEEGKEVSINKLWNRRQSTKSNGVSYITQRGAEAVYTEDAQKEIKENVKYYMDNAKTIKQGLEEIGFETFGGENAPYVWLKTPNGMKSWDFFDELLEKVGVVGTPGVGFGPSGEGYFRHRGAAALSGGLQEAESERYSAGGGCQQGDALQAL